MEKTLEELIKKFNDIKEDLEQLKKTRQQKEEKMQQENVNTNLAIAKVNYEIARNDVKELEALLRSSKLAEEDRPKYEVDLNNAKKALNSAQVRKGEIESQKTEYTFNALEQEQLKHLEQRMEAIIEQFVKDPNINEYLSKKFKYEYNYILGDYDEKLKASNEKYDNLKTLLQSDKFKNEVADMSSIYAAMNAVITQENYSWNDKNQAIAKYTNAIDKLREHLSEEGILDIVLEADDFDAIASGNFVLPSKNREASRIKNEKAGMEDKKRRILARLDSLKVASTGEVVIPADLKALLDEKINAIDTKSNELLGVVEELEAISNNQSRLQELEDKQKGIGSPEQSEFESKTKDYLEKVEKFRKAGYINEYAVPELQDPNSDVSKKYVDYKKANEEFREAMLEYQGDPSDENKNKLEEKIDRYNTISKELEAETKMGPEAWNRYYLEEIKAAAEKGEDIKPIFLDDIAINRAQQIAKQYKSASKTQEYKDFSTNVQEFKEYQQNILDGKEPNDFRSKSLDTYKNGFTALASKLGIELAAIGTIIKDNAMNKVKRSGKFINFLKRAFGFSTTYSVPTIKYNDTITKEDLKGLQDSYSSYKSSKDRYDSYKEGKLKDDEKQELKSLQTSASKTPSLEAKKTKLEQEISGLKKEKTQLDEKLSNYKSSISTKGIKESEYIPFIDNNQAIIDKAMDCIKRAVDDNER